MKGEITVELLGEKIKLSYYLGIEEVLKAYCKANGVKREEVPERFMFSAMEYFANASKEDLSKPVEDLLEPIEKESYKYRALPIHEFNKVTDLVADIQSEIPDDKKKTGK